MVTGHLPESENLSFKYMYSFIRASALVFSLAVTLYFTLHAQCVNFADLCPNFGLPPWQIPHQPGEKKLDDFSRLPVKMIIYQNNHKSNSNKAGRKFVLFNWKRKGGLVTGSKIKKKSFLSRSPTPCLICSKGNSVIIWCRLHAKRCSPAGNRTRVFRVTGGDTDHYTTEDLTVPQMKTNHLFSLRRP